MNQDWNNRPSGDKEPVKNMGQIPTQPTGSANPRQPMGVAGQVGGAQPMGTARPTNPVPSMGTAKPTTPAPSIGTAKPTNSVPPMGNGRPMNSAQPMGTFTTNKKEQDSEPIKAEETVHEKAPAGFFIRLAAYLIDMCIAGCIIGVINVPLLFVKLAMSDSAIFQNILFEHDIFDILNFWLISAYFVIMTYTSGKTVGKMLMKIQVVSETGKDLSFGQVFFREVIGKYLSRILYIGYILIGIQENKKGIHDMIADTKVVYQVEKM